MTRAVDSIGRPTADADSTSAGRVVNRSSAS